MKTVNVDDPAMQKKLPSLKPGQVVQFTYTEAVAAGDSARAREVTAPRQQRGRRRASGCGGVRLFSCQAMPERVSGIA